MTSPIRGAEAAAGAVAIEPLADLSSEGLLAFGAQMTARFDAQITGAINEMQGALGDTDALAHARQGLQQLAAVLTQGNDDPNEPVELSREQYDELAALGVLDELGIDPETAFQTTDETVRIGALELKIGEDANAPSVSANQIDRALAQLELRQSQTNSAQEQRLLFLQETMRQRSQLAQLLSTMFRERGETMSQIVRNIA